MSDAVEDTMKSASLRILANDAPTRSRFHREIPDIASCTYIEANIEFTTSRCMPAIAGERSMNIDIPVATPPSSNQRAILEFQVRDMGKEYACLKNMTAIRYGKW